MLERETDPQKWTSASPNDGANYFINKAPVDELLTKLHAMTVSDQSGPPDVERIEFYKSVLMGRYADVQIKALDRLTTTLNAASKISTLLGIGLILVGLGAWALFGLETYKLWTK